MKKTIWALGAAVLLLAGSALANDSTAELAAGGLILKRTDGIAMASEDLFISQEEVRVKYVFRNVTAKDISTVVAFPMPDIGGDHFWETDVGIPTDDPVNLLGFVTKVDGREVEAKVEQKVFAKGVDRTAWLKARGVPLHPGHDSGAQAALDKLSDADKAEAMRLGLARPDEFDAGKGWEKHLAPIWVLKTTFYWTQVFPAGRDLNVEHSYKPGVGGSVDTIVGSAYWDDDQDARAQVTRRYCIDNAFLTALAKDRAKRPEFSGYQERRIGYVLKTGGNWAGPIGSFRLVVDKGAATNFVSFCATGVNKISPTQFEVRKTNWKPTEDLNILILVPYAPVSQD